MTQFTFFSFNTEVQFLRYIYTQYNAITDMTKDRNLTIRLSSKDEQTIKERAKKLKLSVSEFIRLQATK